jgi:hypothetical protein
MAYKIDIGNVAYSTEYLDYRNKIINETYNQKYKTGEEIFEIKDIDDIKIISEHYLTEDKNYCEFNKIYKNNDIVHEYFNVYDQSFLCEYIKHSNGMDYIFYKEDLYGYSVFEINTGKTFNYYPAATFKNKEETFIGLEIHYNMKNNIFSVGGCYWACPYDVFLIKINNPMKQFTGLINIHEIIDPEYEKYNDIDFTEWKNNDIKVKIDHNKIITLTEKEYMDKIIIV